MPKFTKTKTRRHNVAGNISKVVSRRFYRQFDDINYSQLSRELDVMFERLKKLAGDYIASYMEFRIAVKDEDGTTLDVITYRTKFERLEDWGNERDKLQENFEDNILAPKSGKSSFTIGEYYVLTLARLIFSRPMTGRERTRSAKTRKAQKYAHAKTTRRKASQKRNAKKKAPRRTSAKRGRIRSRKQAGARKTRRNVRLKKNVRKVRRRYEVARANKKARREKRKVRRVRHRGK